MAFLFFILRDRTLRRVPINQATLNEIADKFVNNGTRIFKDEFDRVQFNGQYKPDEDEVLVAQIDLDESFEYIPNNTLEIDVVHLPEDDVIALGLYHDGVYYFQSIFNQIILKNERFALFFSEDLYKKVENRSIFTIDDTVHAIYHDGFLYFMSYPIVNRIFPLRDLFDAANDATIENVISNELFKGTDLEWFKNNADQKMRKQIAQINQDGVIPKINPTSRRFVSLAKKANINAAVYENGHIVLPTTKKECKQVLAFLNQDVFLGIFTKELFRSNSKRKI